MCGVRRAHVRGADVPRADVRGADVRGADLPRADVRGARLLSAVVLAVIVGFAGPTQAEVIDRVLAVVSGGLVLQSDAVAAIRLGLVEVPSPGDRMQVALDRLIERRLMLLEVDRYGPPEPSQADIDAGLAAMGRRIASVDTLDAILAQTGLTAEQLRVFVRDDLRIRAYLQQRFGGSPEAALVRDWVTGLRRRADVTVLYLPVR